MKLVLDLLGELRDLGDLIVDLLRGLADEVDEFAVVEDLRPFCCSAGEPAAGLTRSLMAFMVESYTEDEAPNTKGGVDTRVVLKLDPRLAPVKAAVLPLSRNADLSPKARDLAAELRKNWNVEFDDAGAIGRRYRRQDEIGTPYCITVDFDSLEDHAVTIRERDAMTQERVAIDAVSDYLAVRLRGC